MKNVSVHSIMDIVMENGYNTSYLNNLFFLLFYEDSIIERYVLLENNSPTYDGLYLQHLIHKSIIQRLKQKLYIPHNLTNEIRLFSIISGWNNKNTIDDTFCECDPIEYLNFILNKINFHPIEYINKINNEIEKTSTITLEPTENVLMSFIKWHEINTIINIPTFVIFKIQLKNVSIDINEYIKLLIDSEYHNIQWKFHGLIFKNDTGYSSIVYCNDKKLLYFDDSEFPNISSITYPKILNMKNKLIYIIYTKVNMI